MQGLPSILSLFATRLIINSTRMGSRWGAIANPHAKVFEPLSTQVPPLRHDTCNRMKILINEIGTPNGQPTTERIAQYTVFLVSRYSCEYKKEERKCQEESIQLVSHLTQNTYGKVTKGQENVTYRRALRVSSDSDLCSHLLSLETQLMFSQ